MRRLISILLLQISLSVTAQTEATIRDHYSDINKKIAASAEQDYEGPLYQNQLVVNKNGKSWPAVGYYADTLNFWYDDSPDHLPVSERDPKTELQKVVKSSRYGADVRVTEEYLYQDGKLVFYYQYWAEETNLWETRVYFNSKGLAFKIRVKENDKELTAKELSAADHKDQQPNTARILKTARGYQTLFLTSM